MKASDAVKLLQEFAFPSSDDQDNGKLSWNMWAKQMWEENRFLRGELQRALAERDRSQHLLLEVLQMEVFGQTLEGFESILQHATSRYGKQSMPLQAATVCSSGSGFTSEVESIRKECTGFNEQAEKGISVAGIREVEPASGDASSSAGSGNSRSSQACSVATSSKASGIQPGISGDRDVPVDEQFTVKRINAQLLTRLLERLEDNNDHDDYRNDATAELPAAVERTMEQAQRARHDAGIRGTGDLDMRQTAQAVAGTSAASSSAVRSAPPSATQLSLAAAKEHLAEAAGVALRKAVKALDDAIVACQGTSWAGIDQAVNLLEEAGRLLQQEEPGTRPAANAYDRVDDSRRIEGCPTDTGAVLKAAARATRDVLVLRCCWLVDHRSRDAFLHELATAFQRPIKGELESQLLHAYNTLTSSEHGYDVPDAFTSRNQLHRTRRPRKKGPAGGAEGFVASSGAANSGWRGNAQGQAAGDFIEDVVERCAESVLGADMNQVDSFATMEPMKVTVSSLDSGESGASAALSYDWNPAYSPAPGHFGASSSSSAAPGGLLGAGAPFGAAAPDWGGAFQQRAARHARAGGNTGFGGWQGWHQQQWCGEVLNPHDPQWQQQSKPLDQPWPGSASSSRPYHSYPGGSDRRN